MSYDTGNFQFIDEPDSFMVVIKYHFYGGFCQNNPAGFFCRIGVFSKEEQGQNECCKGGDQPPGDGLGNMTFSAIFQARKNRCSISIFD